MRTYGINELVEMGKGPIWVLNSSNEVYTSGADVFVTITVNDQSQVMQVPRTWLPIDLTARYPRKVILESPFFMEALNKGLLKVVDAEHAMRLLRDEGAAKEQARLKGLEDAIKAATQARGIGRNVTITTGDMEQDEAAAAESARQQGERNAVGKLPARASVTLGESDGDEEESDGISENFKAWVQKVNGIADQEEARSEVKMRGEMDIAEAQYLVQNCVHENIRTQLAKKLAKIAA